MITTMEMKGNNVVGSCEVGKALKIRETNKKLRFPLLESFLHASRDCSERCIDLSRWAAENKTD